MSWDLIDIEKKSCGCIVEIYDHSPKLYVDFRYNTIECDECMMIKIRDIRELKKTTHL